MAISSLLREEGQGTVEAAFLLPAFLFMVFIAIQPAILFYDLMVMGQAAQDGCRLLATKPASDDVAAYEASVRRSLSAIPQQENFHWHDGSCSYAISLEGCETQSTVRVKVVNKVKLFPLCDSGAGLLGLLDDEGLFTLTREAARQTQPDWVLGSSEGLDPRKWTRRWA